MEAQGKITKKTVKLGKNKRGEDYTLTIITLDNGNTYSTFDEIKQNEGDLISFEYKTDGEYNNITKLLGHTPSNEASKAVGIADRNTIIERQCASKVMGNLLSGMITAGKIPEPNFQGLLASLMEGADILVQYYKNGKGAVINRLDKKSKEEIEKYVENNLKTAPRDAEGLEKWYK